jgi:hypothetical protein
MSAGQTGEKAMETRWSASRARAWRVPPDARWLLSLLDRFR